MRRLLITALILLATGSINSLQAQKSRQYDDDIYGSKPSKVTQQEESTQSTGANLTYDNPRVDEEQTYSASGNGSGNDNRNNYRQSGDEYYDSDDDYYYSSRINRFNYPFYNRPYWSSFYNPYWYDPFWVDPYWGWSPWTRPGLTISFGYGPYWSSYWGWNSWYGCPQFGSYWGSPWGGWGYGGGFYSGYWNGYYAGLYNGYGYGDGRYGGGRRQAITYGPRYSLRPEATRNTSIGAGGYNGFRTAPARSGANTDAGAIRSEAAAARSGRYNSSTGAAGSAPAVRAERGRDVGTRENQSYSTPRGDDRPVRGAWTESNPNRGGTETNDRQDARPTRGAWNNGAGRSEAPAPRNSETPRAQEQRNYAPARSEQRYEPAPSRSYDRGGGNFGGGRSFGGGNNGGGRSMGGGGGSFGGGGRRR